MVAALPREKRKPALRRKETQSVKRNIDIGMPKRATTKVTQKLR
ncbi:unnamed protein product [Brassica napus]|uniref:(rape) hypothetical protein n=1 Tax=Brassica napus TaxID=3708 RepID=A0A816IPC8_BRANA|nr:unnamed protein product [Brassica napus]